MEERRGRQKVRGKGGKERLVCRCVVGQNNCTSFVTADEAHLQTALGLGLENKTFLADQLVNLS